MRFARNSEEESLTSEAMILAANREYRPGSWLLTHDFCNCFISLLLTERNSRSAGIEYDQLDWLIRGVATVRGIDAFRQGLPRLENLPFPAALLFQNDFAGQNISGVDHRVLMPIERCISWDRDFENRYLGPALKITYIRGPFPGMGRLEQLFHFDAGVVSIGFNRQRETNG